MIQSQYARSAFVALMASGLFIACADSAPTAIEETRPLAAADLVLQPRFLVCPTTRGDATSGTIGPTGGVLGVDGARLEVPPGAVLHPTEFRIRVPADPVVRVTIEATGTDHYRFRRPVTVTIGYARCRRLPATALRVWYIDDALGTPLEDMGGEQDASARTVAFHTTHLSTYAVAY